MLDLNRNLLTTLLAGGIGLLGLAGVGMAVLLGRPDVDAIEPEGRTGSAEVQVDVPETGLASFESYSAIIERPVFFSDRRLPVVEAPGSEMDETEPEPVEIEQIEALKARVAGIVITPDLKLAMVADEQAGKTLVLREGMSLEGEQAAWRLDDIQARQVRFVSVDGRETDLELKVNTSGLTAPSVTQRASAPAEVSDADEAGAQQAGQDRASEEARARAEEIRRRVAERRAQLRAEAERRAQQRQEQQDNDG